MKKRPSVFSSLALAGFFGLVALIEISAFGQKASVPKPQTASRLSPEQVKQLISLMDRDRNGKISKQEWMRFMEQEFDRLDKDHSGDLDAADLAISELEPSKRPFSAAGK
jgi:Ca2+-binding EF-hand superfamily protein